MKMNPNELCIEMTSTKNTVYTDGICPTLTARMGTGAAENAGQRKSKRDMRKG